MFTIIRYITQPLDKNHKLLKSTQFGTQTREELSPVKLENLQVAQSIHTPHNYAWI